MIQSLIMLPTTGRWNREERMLCCSLYMVMENESRWLVLTVSSSWTVIWAQVRKLAGLMKGLRTWMPARRCLDRS